MTGQPVDLERRIIDLATELSVVKEEIAKRIVGQANVVELALISILCGGHTLFFGMPGLGKTKIVETLAGVLGLSSNRIQFTPDLMPTDILGSDILQTKADGTRQLEFVKGPVFCQLLMADEINRASPRTQAALLQAMQERQISISGSTLPLPAPFLVVATQNSIEFEGTYPLPEAQLDRFFVRVSVDYPSRSDEERIIEVTTGLSEAPINSVLTGDDLVNAQRIIRRMPTGQSTLNLLLDVVRTCRPGSANATERISEFVELGAGPRASQALSLAIRASALLRGDLAPSASDIVKLAVPVLGHRMKLSHAALAAGVQLDEIINEAVMQQVGKGGLN